MYSQWLSNHCLDIVSTKICPELSFLNTYLIFWQFGRHNIFEMNSDRTIRGVRITLYCCSSKQMIKFIYLFIDSFPNVYYDKKNKKYWELFLLRILLCIIKNILICNLHRHAVNNKWLRCRENFAISYCY